VQTGQPHQLEDVYPALRALLLRSIGAPVEPPEEESRWPR